VSSPGRLWHHDREISPRRDQPFPCRMTIITGKAFAFRSPRLRRNCFNSTEAEGTDRPIDGVQVMRMADFSVSLPCPADNDFTIWSTVPELIGLGLSELFS